MGDSTPAQRANRTAMAIAAVYLAVSSAWILFSDRFVALLPPERLSAIQSVKGLAFVVVSSLALFVLTRAYLRRALEQEASARAEAERSQALLAASPGAVLAVDRGMRITAANPAAESVLGVGAAELRGRPVADLVSGPADRVIEETVRRVVDGEVIENAEGLVCVKGGRRFWASAWAAPLPASGGAVFVVLDHTREWRLERKEQRRSRQLREFERRMAEALEDERREIAEELHDGLGQTLAAAKVNLQLIGAGVEDAAERTAAVSVLIDEALATSRTFAYALYPPPLKEWGLMAAVQWLVDRKNGTDTVVWSASGDVRVVDPAIGAALYRTIAELAHNVTRHAEAKAASVALTALDCGIEVRVTDDGRGFAGDPASFGLGLCGVASRVARLGGRLRVESRPGHTEVIVEVPIPACESPQKPV